MLTALDITLLVIVGLSCVVGLWRGFVVEAMALVVWVAAFWLAFVYGESAAALFEGHVTAASARLLLGYAILFIGALVAGGLVTWLLGKLVRSTGLSGTDRLLGLGFGLLRGLALGSLLVLLLGFTPMPEDGWWRESRLLVPFQRGAEWMRGWLPASVAEHVDFDPAAAVLEGLATPPAADVADPRESSPGSPPDSSPDSSPNPPPEQ